MSARVIVSGAVGKPADIRTSKNGNTFATFSVRESLNGSTRWWQAIAFSETVIEALKELSAGEPIAVAGEFSCEIYAPAGSESRLNWRITIDGVLIARKPPKAKADVPSRKPKANRRGTAEASWALPTRAAVETSHAKKGTDFDDSIPF
jgi:hypothetical protein